MKSFPSTLNRGGSNLQVTNVPSSIKDTLKNSWSAAVNAGKSSMTSGEGLDTEGIRYNDDPDKESLLDKLNITEDTQILLTHKQNSGVSYEDPLHIPLEAINVTNRYKGVIYSGALENVHKPSKKDSSSNVQYKQQHVVGVVGSLFNPYYGMMYTGPTGSTPLMLNQSAFRDSNTDNCSISNLVSLSKHPKGVLGQARYKYADFMYCKHLGKVANNHLITLRKFATPVGDNIFEEAAGRGSDNSWSMMGDVGRMVTWFGTEDNKLEDILKYDYEATWRELKAEIDQQQSQEGANAQGNGMTNLLSRAVLAASPSFHKGIINGTNPALTLPFTNITIPAGQYQNNDVVLGKNYDKNKVYEPKNTVRTTHVYEGELKFNHEFNLTFSYKLRAYDNINPKAAFLDLLSNVLMTTYRRGDFWGGRNEILGVQPNTHGWNFANNLIQKGGEMAKEWIQQLVLGGGEDLLGSILGGLANAGNAIMNAVSSGVNKLKEAIGNGSWKDYVANNANAAIDLATGMIKNQLGRPAVYQFNSLLNGGDTGLWHVTIGNPLNPIASFGNLIMTKASIQHLGPLGVDDFPSELKVTVTLKHARPRDAFAIQKMYTKGVASIYQPLTGITDPSKLYNFGAFGASIDKSKYSKKNALDENGEQIVDEEGNPVEVETIDVIATSDDIIVDDNIVSDTGNLFYADATNYMGDYDMQRIQSNRLQLS